MCLSDLLQKHESKTLEFKVNLSSPEKILKTVVAFSNTAGGIIVIGVEDKTRSVKGISNILLEEERLVNMISDCIEPAIVPEIEIAQWRRKAVLMVKVHPSNCRPHYLKKTGSERGIYIRVGSTNRIADSFMIEELKRVGRPETFDEQPMAKMGKNDLDTKTISESFKGVRKISDSEMRSLKLWVKDRGKEVPSIGAVILFGNERNEHFPDAWIQAGRFRGTDRTQIEEMIEIREYPVNAIAVVMSFIKRNISGPVTITETKRRETWKYPLIVLREAVINSIVHADYAQRGCPIRVSIYSDRIEIENPGLLPFGLTIEDVTKGVSKLRNRVIGRVFNSLGLIEQWGSGIQRMISVCKDSSMRPPIIEELGTNFRVTFFVQRTEPGKRNKVFSNDSILTALSGAPEGLSTQALSERIGLSTRATRSRLVSLIKKGLILEEGAGPNDPRKVFRLLRL